MSRRRYRKYNKEPGLFEIAARSDWKVSTVLAGLSAFAAAVVIAALTGASPVLGPIVFIFAPLAWLFAAGFAFISVILHQPDEFSHPHHSDTTPQGLDAWPSSSTPAQQTTSSKS